MANNEIKVKITADNKQFLKAIDEVTGAVKKLNSLKTTDIDIVLSKADTVMRQIGEIGKALLGIADRSIRITADTSQALGEIGKVQEAINRLPDKTVKVTADTTQATSDISQIRGELDKIKATQDIEVRLVGNPSTLLESLIDRLRNTELALNVNFSGVTESARVFKTVLDSINRALRQFLSRINAIGNRRIRIRMDIRMPQIDTRWMRSDLFRNAIASADAFIAKLRTINEMLARTVQLADRIRIPPGGGGGSVGGGGGADGGFFGGFLGGLTKAGAVIAGITYALGKVKDVAAAIIMPGFNYTKEMETSQLGIAGILTSMTNLDGKAMDFASAMGISDDIMQKLQRDAILTSATTEEMVTTFRALLAPGIGAGMSIDEIQQFTTVGVNAVKAIGLDSSQFVQELRDLVQGGIQASSSTLATSLGLTDADIKAAKASSEGLFKFLMDRMAGFAPMAEEFPKTLTGKLSILGEFSTLASAKITEAFKPEIKAALDLVTGLIGTINKKTNEFEPNPKILEFVDMLKSGADNIIELFGQMNDKGQFELNPKTIDFFDGLGNGIRAVWDLLVSLGSTVDTLFNNSAFSIVKDYWIPILADLWSMAVDIVDMFTAAITVINNLADSVLNAVAPFDKFSSNAVKWAVEQLKEFVHMAKLGWDMLVKLSGGTPSKDDGGKRAAWQKKSEAQERKAAGGKGDITSKNGPKGAEEAAKKAEKERIKASQEAMKKMLQYWKDQLDKIQRDFKRQQDALKLRYDQGAIGGDEYFTKELQTNIASAQAEIDNLTSRKGEIEGREFEKESERQNMLDPLDRQIEILTENMGEWNQALKEIFGLQGRLNHVTPKEAIEKYKLDPAGFESKETSSRDGRNISPVDVARQLIAEKDEAGNPLHMYGDNKANPNNFVCTQFVVKSWDGIGLEDALHEAGIDTKGSDGNDMRNWVPAMMEVAKKLGAWADAGAGYTPKAGDAIVVNGDNHVVMATGEGAGYVASSQTGRPIGEGSSYLDAFGEKITGFISLQKMMEAANIKGGFINQGIGETKSRQAYEYAQSRNETRGKALDVLRDYNAMIGDISSTQIEDLNRKYAETIVALQRYPLDKNVQDAISKLGKVLESDTLKINFAQTQQDLEYANNDLAEFQGSLAKSVSDSTVSAKTLMQAYIERYHEQTDKYRKQLEDQLRAAQSQGLMGEANKIKAALKALTDGLQTGLENLISAYDSELQMQIAEINANRKMTRLQKQDAIDAAERRQYGVEAGKARERIVDLKASNASGSNDAKIQQLEREAALKDKLAEIPSLLDDVHRASTQAFEDGLLDFLTKGILECESLGEAFRNMAITILESIQKVFAEDMTKKIMVSLGFGDSYKAPGSNQDATSAEAAALSGSFGTVTTETNGFLVSFNGQMGEFAIRTQTAFQGILQTIQSAANSIPSIMPSFSFGGSGAGSGSGGFEYNSPSGNNWWNSLPSFSGGGAISSDGVITGPGTGTSDSILAWLSNGERVVDAATVQKWGQNFFDRLKSGDIYNLHIPIPKFARGGAVGSAGASAAAHGLDGFSANIGANMSPVFNNNTDVRISERSLLNAMSGAIDAQVTSKMDKNMQYNSKRYEMMLGLTRRGR